jgi:hypothetical protein
METEKIKLKTETGQLIEVVVLSKHADRIEVVIGESVRCALTPTRNKLAYAGSVRGRELVYERSYAQVQAEVDKRDPRRRRTR